jgi:hypothetical protein
MSLVATTPDTEKRRGRRRREVIQKYSRLIPPQSFEPHRTKLGVSHRVPDVLVAEIGLDRAGIDAKHVRVHREAELGARAEPLHHLLKPVHRDRGLAFRHEQMG